jgi:hypothetical protein
VQLEVFRDMIPVLSEHEYRIGYNVRQKVQKTDKQR